MAGRRLSPISSAVSWCLLVLLHISNASAQLLTLSNADTGQSLNASNIVVGTASDLALQVQCISSTPSATITWNNGTGMEISQGLVPFGTSQGNGVLRVYPVTMLSMGMNTFTCSDGNVSQAVQIERRPHLFFTSPVPEQVPPTADVAALCPIPDIPAGNVTVINRTGFSYCQVATERGTFRSRSIITEEEVPSFQYEPLDIAVNPFDLNSSRAAFSCAISGIKPVYRIRWYFEMMQFGSGSGLDQGPMNGILTSGEQGVTISSGDVSASRASVLLLENIDSNYEGLYRCVVTFSDGQVLSSRNASLRFNATPAAEESILLSPPPNLSVLSGQTLFLPCVSSGPTLPSFSRVVVATPEVLTMGVTQLGLEITGVTAANAGTYTCTVGGVTANTTVNVSLGLFPPSGVNVLGSVSPPEHLFIDTAITGCLSVGNDAILLMDSTVLQMASGNVADSITSSGFYQCAASRTDLSADNLYTSEQESIYILRAFLRDTAVALSQQIVVRGSTDPGSLSLTCTAEANPLPRFSWTVNDIPSSSGVQAVTGFMEIASSTLSLSLAELNLGANSVSCTASIDSPVIVGNPATATVTMQAAPVILTPPADQTVLAPGEAVFTCTVEGFPLPSVTWLRNGEETPLTPGGNVVIQESSSTSTRNSTLTLSPTDISLSGNYSCVASNSLNSVTVSAQLTVNGAPVILTPPANQTVLAPAEAFFTCTVEGFPPPSITWLRVAGDGTETVLTEGGNVTISELSSALAVTSNLTLSPTDITSSDEYTCVANNSFGSENAFAQLTVNGAPVILTPPASQTVLAPAEAFFTCTVEGFPPPSITWLRVAGDGTETVLTEGGNVTISELSSALAVTSNLTLSPTDITLSDQYMCVANNNFGSENVSAQLTVNATPVFLVNPLNKVVVANGDIVELNCTAQGNPLPTIVWISNGSLTDTDTGFNENSTGEEFATTSVLSFMANEGELLRGNGSILLCQADNGIMDPVQSTQTVVIIAGPPLPPNITTITPMARSALVTWQQPFSLLPITGYLINITETVSGNLLVSIETVSASSLNFNASSLRPNQMHNVSIVAMSQAGVSEVTTRQFITLEDVPDGFPGNVQSTSTELGSITVTWGELAANDTNGIIIGYMVQLISEPSSAEFLNVTSGNTFTATIMIVAGNTYRISVAARTAVGLGPYSPEITQQTIDPPSPFPTDPLPIAGPPTGTTIPINLPTVPEGSFSHYWVIVMRLESTESFDTSRDPSQLYNSSFVFANYSAMIPVNTPYIAAEISDTNYTAGMSFILGDEEGAASINDFPNLYRNGPLQEGSSYTAFVRAFSRSVLPGMRARRQSGTRQYSIFVSSPFLAPVSIPVPGLTAGAIVGIILGVIVCLILVVAIVIVSILLIQRSRFSKEYGLPQPPSRKGSMKIRDHREIIPSVTMLRNLKAEAELQNLNPDDQRQAVLLEDFASYVKTMHANTDHLFSEEYEILSIKSPSLAHVQCSLPYNVAKNRYANINCYDDTRVRLDIIPGIEGSDYINANYIDSYLEKRGFIATQGPLAQTTQDFWRMVWEQKSSCIIMLTNIVEKNRAKCHQYWPEVGSLSLDDITVTLIETQQLAYYTVRTFKMGRGNDRREVKQFHYTGWPDFGVPDYPHPVIAFIKRISNFKPSTPGPFIIHCSAGVGRTGTLMTVQAMIHMMEEEGKLDIFNFVLGLRHQRNYMVQTERQYIFIHDCILEIIKIGDTSIPIQALRRRHKELVAHDSLLDTSRMEVEYARLNELQILEESQFDPARLPMNQSKNRFQNILPYDRFRVRLLLHPGVAGSDYINASYIDGYQHRHQYIVTQGPMKNTMTDFWRMVWEHRVSCILMVCPLEEKGKEQCVRYWPTEKIIQQGDMFIELNQMTDYGSYTMREFSVTNTKINESRVIKHYQHTDWLEDAVPTNAATIIDLIGVLQKAQHMLGGGPIIVHDSTSVGRSATFCILGSILEQLKVEGTIDLFATIHALRHQQPGLVSSFELYKFCYQAVLEFLDSFDHYANFD